MQARDKYRAKVEARARLGLLDLRTLPALRRELATTERSHEADPQATNLSLLACIRRNIERAENERRELEIQLAQ